MELYLKYRPTDLKEVIGQSGAVSSLESLIKAKRVPHAAMFTGPSGCGKTTLALCLSKHLRCNPRDLTEVNCAIVRGIDAVRDIKENMGYLPSGGKSRVWILDEAHQLTPDAQQALLLILEDIKGLHKYAYFFLCSTEPSGIINTIKTRCTEIKVESLITSDMKNLITRVCKKEEIHIEREVKDQILVSADGSARKALVLLEQVAGIEDTEAQIKAISSPDASSTAYELCQALVKSQPWSKIAKILKNCEERPETVRIILLGYANTILLGGGRLAARAYLIIVAFNQKFYDAGAKAMLSSACWEVTLQK